MVNSQQRFEYLMSYIKRTLKHSREVGDLIIYIIKNRDKLSFDVDPWKLLNRSVRHDVDKFSEKYLTNMINYLYFSDNLTDQEKDKLNESYLNHKKTQRHHLMYYEINSNEQIQNEDICEMACDWISSARKDNSRLIENADIWKNNFENGLKKSSMLEPYRDRFYSVFDLMNEYFGKRKIQQQKRSIKQKTDKR